MDKETHDKVSLLSQAIADVILITALSSPDYCNKTFLDGVLRNSGESDRNNIEYIIKECGLGNPAMLQMCLYALLLIPRELLGDDYCKIEVNEYVKNNIICFNSTYPGEEQNDGNYYRHIRNSVAHSNCEYEQVDCRTRVIFKDVDTKNGYHCELTMEFSKVGELLDILLLGIKLYLNDKMNKN